MDILYSFRRCPYAMRARLALLVSGTRFEIREVVLRDKPQAMIDVSPKATVPVLALASGQVIDQSLDIMRWALARHDPEDWLDGDDPEQIATFDDRFKHHLDRYKYADRYATNPAVHRAAALEMLVDLDDIVSRTGTVLRHDRSITNVAILPFVRQFAAVDPRWFDAQSIPHIHGSLARLVASPLFETCMTRLVPWRPGVPPVIWGGP